MSYILRTTQQARPYPSTRLAFGESFGAQIWEQTLGRHIGQARDACLQELRRIPTGLGRLAYLAILRQQLLADHNELFHEFCSCSLQYKYEWVFRLLASAIHAGTLPDEWFAASAYSELAPQSAEMEEKERYLADIEVTLQILKTELNIDRDRLAPLKSKTACKGV